MVNHENTDDEIKNAAQQMQEESSPTSSPKRRNTLEQRTKQQQDAENDYGRERCAEGRTDGEHPKDNERNTHAHKERPDFSQFFVLGESELRWVNSGRLIHGRCSVQNDW